MSERLLPGDLVRVTGNPEVARVEKYIKSYDCYLLTRPLSHPKLWGGSFWTWSRDQLTLVFRRERKVKNA